MNSENKDSIFHFCCISSLSKLHQMASTEVRKKNVTEGFNRIKITDPITARLNLSLKTSWAAAGLSHILLKRFTCYPALSTRHGRTHRWLSQSSLSTPVSLREVAFIASDIFHYRNLTGWGKNTGQTLITMMWEILTQKSIFFTLGKGDQKKKKNHFQDKQWEKYFSVSKYSYCQNIYEGNGSTENPKTGLAILRISSTLQWRYCQGQGMANCTKLF